MRSVVFFKHGGSRGGAAPPRGGFGGERSPPHFVSNDQKKKIPLAPLKPPPRPFKLFLSPSFSFL